MAAFSTNWMAKLYLLWPSVWGCGESLFFSFNRIIVRIQKIYPGRYTLISPILAPFSRSSTLSGTNSRKTSTNVLVIPRFSVIRLSGALLKLKMTANSTYWFFISFNRSNGEKRKPLFTHVNTRIWIGRTHPSVYPSRLSIFFRSKPITN
jgi:hypothetical protein